MNPDNPESNPDPPGDSSDPVVWERFTYVVLIIVLLIRMLLK